MNSIGRSAITTIDQVFDIPVPEEGRRGPGRPRQSLQQRFIAKTYPAGECLLWRGHIDRYGYGIIWWDGKPFKAHRLAYLLAYGELPKNANVTSTCGNRHCVHYLHLRLESAKKRPRRKLKARTNPNQRLRETDVREIRRRRLNGESAKILAREFGVSERHIYSLARKSPRAAGASYQAGA